MTEQDRFPATYEGLRQLVERLRGPDGCPWDREQTADSLKRVFLEECYELIEAIEQDDPRKTSEELGDVLFNLVFQIKIGIEDEAFSEEQVFGAVIEKLVRRHPHVFGDATAATAEAVMCGLTRAMRCARLTALGQCGQVGVTNTWMWSSSVIRSSCWSVSGLSGFVWREREAMPSIRVTNS